MAFLMLLHEKMRLLRKINILTYKQLRASSRKERVTKQIERIQKMYEKRHTRMQKQADILRNQFRTGLYNSMGLGTMGQMFNPMFGGMTSFVMNQAMSLFTNKGGVPINGADKNYLKGLNESDFNNCMTLQNSGGIPRDDKGNYDWKKAGVTEDQWKAFQMCMSQAQNMQSQAQMYCQNMETQYQTNISIWLEQAEAQMEMEQDEALLPLQEEETEWDMESQSAEVQLADAKARLEGIKQALSEGIKDSAPTFGLG